MKIKEKILKEWLIEEKLTLGRMDIPLKKLSYGQLRRLVEKTLTEVEKTHVSNEFMLEKLKEQRIVDMLEVKKVIDEEIKYFDKPCMEFNKAMKFYLKNLKQKLEEKE